jgi:hypothetical protein
VILCVFIFFHFAKVIILLFLAKTFILVVKIKLKIEIQSVRGVSNVLVIDIYVYVSKITNKLYYICNTKIEKSPARKKTAYAYILFRSIVIKTYADIRDTLSVNPTKFVLAHGVRSDLF